MSLPLLTYYGWRALLLVHIFADRSPIGQAGAGPLHCSCLRRLLDPSQPLLLQPGKTKEVGQALVRLLGTDNKKYGTE